MKCLAAIAFLLVLALTGCGGSGSASQPPSQTPTPADSSPSISSISPATATAGSPDFTLTFTGSNLDLKHSGSHQTNTVAVWSANGVSTALTTTVVSSTQITAVVPAVLLSKPTAAQVQVQKWYFADDSPFAVSNSLSFIVMETNPPGDSNSRGAVSIYPASETLRIGGQRRFSGWDSTVGQYDVTWSLQEGGAAGTITPDGLYTAPGTPGTFHLIATSSHDTSLRATATLTIVSVGFVPIGDMDIARAGHTATPLLDGRVLIAGGTTDAAHSAELFLPASSSFAPAGGMVHARSGHCASLLPDGRVLIAGGSDSNGNLFKTAELFDSAAQSFTTTGDLNQARTGATATPLPNGKVLIAGGQDAGGSLLSSAELYDPKTGSFALAGNLHLARAQHTATLLSNGKVLLVGSASETGSAELFDPASGLFTPTGSLIQARAHHTATLLPNGYVLVLGGTQIMPPGGGGAPPAPVSLDSAEIYDPATGKFQTAGKLLIARDSHSATLLANGTVLVAGGYSHGFDGDADPTWYTMVTAELFDPASSVSATAASLESDRAEHVATMLNNGEVLITGGVAGHLDLCCHPKPFIVTLASAELYN